MERCKQDKFCSQRFKIDMKQEIENRVLDKSTFEMNQNKRRYMHHSLSSKYTTSSSNGGSNTALGNNSSLPMDKCLSLFYVFENMPTSHGTVSFTTGKDILALAISMFTQGQEATDMYNHQDSTVKVTRVSYIKILKFIERVYRCNDVDYLQIKRTISATLIPNILDLFYFVDNEGGTAVVDPIIYYSVISNNKQWSKRIGFQHFLFDYDTTDAITLYICENWPHDLQITNYRQTNDNNTILGSSVCTQDETDHDERCSDIQTPILIINGELDSNTPVSGAKALHNDFFGGKSTLLIVPFGGHNPSLSVSCVKDAIEKFINSNDMYTQQPIDTHNIWDNCSPVLMGCPDPSSSCLSDAADLLATASNNDPPICEMLKDKKDCLNQLGKCIWIEHEYVPKLGQYPRSDAYIPPRTGTKFRPISTVTEVHALNDSHQSVFVGQCRNQFISGKFGVGLTPIVQEYSHLLNLELLPTLYQLFGSNAFVKELETFYQTRNTKVTIFYSETQKEDVTIDVNKDTDPLTNITNDPLSTPPWSQSKLLTQCSKFSEQKDQCLANEDCLWLALNLQTVFKDLLDPSVLLPIVNTSEISICINVNFFNEGIKKNDKMETSESACKQVIRDIKCKHRFDRYNYLKKIRYQATTADATDLAHGNLVDWLMMWQTVEVYGSDAAVFACNKGQVKYSPQEHPLFQDLAETAS